MKVEKVYQDEKGEWHIDYGLNHLMGLAIRVYFGQFVICIIILIPLLVIAILFGFTSDRSIPEENALPGNVRYESTNHEFSSSVSRLKQCNKLTNIYYTQKPETSISKSSVFICG